MDHDQLGARHTAAIRRHWRTLADNGGTPSGPLLAELAAIADEHAQEGAAPPVPLQPPGSGSSAAADPGRIVAASGNGPPAGNGKAVSTASGAGGGSGTPRVPRTRGAPK